MDTETVIIVVHEAPRLNTTCSVISKSDSGLCYLGKNFLQNLRLKIIDKYSRKCLHLVRSFAIMYISQVSDHLFAVSPATVIRILGFISVVALAVTAKVIKSLRNVMQTQVERPAPFLQSFSLSIPARVGPNSFRSPLRAAQRSLAQTYAQTKGIGKKELEKTSCSRRRFYSLSLYSFLFPIPIPSVFARERE